MNFIDLRTPCNHTLTSILKQVRICTSLLACNLVCEFSGIYVGVDTRPCCGFCGMRNSGKLIPTGILSLSPGGCQSRLFRRLPPRRREMGHRGRRASRGYPHGSLQAQQSPYKMRCSLRVSPFLFGQFPAKLLRGIAERRVDSVPDGIVECDGGT